MYVWVGGFSKAQIVAEIVCMSLVETLKKTVTLCVDGEGVLSMGFDCKFVREGGRERAERKNREEREGE